MLDIRLIRDKTDFVEKSLARRHGNFSVKPLLSCDEEYRRAQVEWEELNRRTNEISEQFKKGKLEPAEAELLKEETKKLKIRRQEIEVLRQELEPKLLDLQLGLPNLPDEAVPEGTDEKQTKK